MHCFSIIIIFFFKQKTAYEMRISDWSSDVCSSDLQKSSAQKNTSDQPQNGTPQTRTQNGAQNTEQNTKPASPQQQAPSKPQSRQADDKTRAEQDAQEAANAAAKSRQSGTDKPMQAIDAKTDEPKSEQQLAEEQWLRQIPDDPGGLLRRKFMIAHLMRQQQDK